MGFKLGEIINNKYQIKRVLAQSELYNTYLVSSISANDLLVLKAVSDKYKNSDKLCAKFFEVCKGWLKLQKSLHVNKIHTIFESYDTPYILTDYIAPAEEAPSALNGYMGKFRLEIKDLLYIFIQICNGLDYAYSESVFHGNLTPSNILLTQDKLVKITDFGMNSIITELGLKHFYSGFSQNPYSGLAYQSIDGTGYGNPIYMSPEQFFESEKCDFKSDIYSLGIIMYQTLNNGKPPFIPIIPRDDTFPEFKKYWEKIFKLHKGSSPSKLKTPFFPIIKKCLAGEKKDRYESIASLREELEDFFEKIAGKKYSETGENIFKASEINNKALILKILGKLDDSMTLLNKAADLDPDNIFIQINKGDCLYNKGLYAESIMNLDKVTVLEPGNSFAWFRLGNNNAMIGKFSEALKCFDKVLEINPDYYGVYRDKGKALLEIDRFLDALICFTKGIEYYPKSMELWLLKGKTYFFIKKYNDAIKCFNKCIELDPHFAEAYLEMGNYFHALGRTDEAVSYWNKAYEINKKLAYYWIIKAELLMDQELYESAIEHYEKAIELDEKRADAWSGKGYAFFKLMKFEEAIKNYDTALTLKKWDVITITRKGNALVELMKRGEAFICFDEAIAIAPWRIEGWLNKGNLNFSLLKFEEALICYNKVIELNGKFFEAWVKKADCLRLLASYNDAITIYNRAIEIDPDNENVWLSKGDSYRGLNNFSKSIHCYNKALALNPQMVIAWINKGDAFRWMGKNKQSLECYEKAIELTPRSTQILNRLGNVYFDLKDYTKAKEYFDRVLMDEMNNPGALFGKAYTEEKLGNKELALNIWQKYIEVAKSDPSQKEFIKIANEHFKDLNIKF